MLDDDIFFFNRMVRRKKSGKKRRGKGSTNSVSSVHSLPSPVQLETEESNHSRSDGTHVRMEDGVCFNPLDLLNGQVQSDTELRESGEDEEPEAMLRLPEMSDTSMDNVGKPLRDVVDLLNGALDRKTWETPETEEEKAQRELTNTNPGAALPQQQPFQEDEPGEPPDPESQPLDLSSPSPAHFYCFTTQSTGAAAQSGSRHDSAGHGQSPARHRGHEDDRKGETQQEASSQIEQVGGEAGGGVVQQNGSAGEEIQPDENTHPAEFRYDSVLRIVT